MKKGLGFSTFDLFQIATENCETWSHQIRPFTFLVLEKLLSCVLTLKLFLFVHFLWVALMKQGISTTFPTSNGKGKK